MAEERMAAKQYAKYEKVFYLYGSLSKMVQPVRPDEWKALVVLGRNKDRKSVV